MTHSPKRRKSAVFAEFHEFLSSPSKHFGPQFQYLSLEKLLFLVAKTNFHFIFLTKKYCFRRISWVFIGPPKIFFGPQFPYLSLEKLLFFVPKINFHFIFSGIKNSYAEKSAVFAEFHEFLSFSKLFFW